MTATICHNRQWKFLICLDLVSSVQQMKRTIWLVKTYTDPFYNEMASNNNDKLN